MEWQEEVQTPQQFYLEFSSGQAQSPQRFRLPSPGTLRSIFGDAAVAAATLSPPGVRSVPSPYNVTFSNLPLRSVENSPAPNGLRSDFEISYSRSPRAIEEVEPSEDDGPHGDSTEDEVPASTLSQSKSIALGFEKYHAEIKKLYIDDDLTLKETMEIMMKRYSFSARRKQYTDKIKEWRWVKNLPGAKAQWMLRKADKRKQQDGKETSFHYGNRAWAVDRIQKTAKRAKVLAAESDIDDLSTPADITYATPQNNVQTLGTILSRGDTVVQSNAVSTIPTQPVRPLNSLRLVWNGQTRSDVEKTYHEAEDLEGAGKIAEAEHKFRRALEGFENLLTPVHDDTSTVAYQLADFYARNNRMLDADLVLNRIIQGSMDFWGIEHCRTMAHLVRIADMFHGWSRTQDAVSLLVKAVSIQQETLRHIKTTTGTPRSFQARLICPDNTPTVSQDDPPRLINANAPREDGDHPLQAENLLNVSKTSSGATVAEEDPETSILQLIDLCERHPGRLAVQILETRRALLELYQKSNNTVQLAVALIDAETSFLAIMKSDLKISAPLIREAIKMIAFQVKHSRLEAADNMFYKVQVEVVDTFGVHDDITISTLISIGVIYQEHERWSDARPRFEQALSASMVANGLNSNLTQNLEIALERRCYTGQRPEPGDLTSAFDKRGARCLGHEFGCCDTRSLLDVLFSQDKRTLRS